MEDKGLKAVIRFVNLSKWLQFSFTYLSRRRRTEDGDGGRLSDN